MKKIYIKPETLFVEVELQRMIALSRYDDPASNGEVLSRRGRRGFDEEDDEDMDGDEEEDDAYPRYHGTW
jgi:hypothetical protein